MLHATRPRPGTGQVRPLPALFADAVAADPAAPLVADGSLTLTRAGVAHRAGVLAARLTATGVKSGDVVAVQMPNRSETVAAFHAIWSLGAVPCAITPIYRGAELEAILAAARPVAVVTPEVYGDVDYPGMAAAALDRAGVRASVAPVDMEDGEPAGDALPPTSPTVSPDDIALLMFTSGTTGHPKGVLHTHRTLIVEAQSIADVFGLRADPIFMPSPLCHVTGLLYGIMLPLLTGGSVVLSDRWNPDEAARSIQTAGCRFTVAATPFLRGLADAYRRRGGPSALEVFVCGGADIPADLVREAGDVMGTTVCRTYGSTEMPTLCIVRPDDDPVLRLTTEGRVLGGEATIVDVEDDDPQAPPRGELLVRGPELFVGYLDPSDNDDAFTADGWFRTGDLARALPGGEIAIQGRRKDLIVRGGENISAKEVEDLLVAHPAVRDVAVVGLPDDLMGERACAVIVLDADAGILSLRDVQAHLGSSGIAKQKFPEALWVVDSLPRTPSGKVQKYQLRAEAAGALARGEITWRERPDAR